MCWHVLNSVLWNLLRFLHKKQCSVRLYLQLFVRGCMSYLRYFCLFTHSGVKHILCCVYVLFFLVLCTIYYHFLWIVHVWLYIRYFKFAKSMLHRPTCLVDFVRASSLKHIVGRHVSPLRYIILIAGQPVFASPTPQYILQSIGWLTTWTAI
jgi:hypothetical protein